MHRALRRGASRRERGIVALEFVLVLPILLLIALGIVDVSLMLYDKAQLTNAAGEAVRQGAMLRTTPYQQTNVQTVAQTYLANNLISRGTPSAQVLLLPTGGCSTVASGSPITVTISYQYSGMVLGSALSTLTGPVTVSAMATQDCE